MSIFSANKLEAFRSLMPSLGIDAFIVGSGDAHQSEYVSNSEARREFISGFTGSAGTALILQDKALLWTDGRYFLQASQELSSDWTLMKSGETGVLELNDWLKSFMKPKQVVGVDASLISAATAKSLKAMLASVEVSLVGVENNPVDQVWGTLKPPMPSNPVAVHALTYAGASHADKISEVRKQLSAHFGGRYGAGGGQRVGIIFSMLDEIMWLLNIRGADVDFNPVAYCYAVVTDVEAVLFIEDIKLTGEVRDHLALAAVRTMPYNSVAEYLAAGGEFLSDSSQLNWRLSCLLKGDTGTLEKPSSLTLAKSLKNPSELSGVVASHIRDGAALTSFLCWLEKSIDEGVSVTEYDASVKLAWYRSQMEMNVGLSFCTIAGYGPNGAIIHYRPDEKSSAVIGKDSLFLLDSGGQYLDGTTDTTRTMHFGIPTKRMKMCYTLVLKGHIALARVVFPEGTLGSRFDSLARMHLWTAGLDYNHGTGHGVGAYLNVHEGPQSISFRKRDNETGFFPGMTISNEPGYYEEGNFGIRIENVCVTMKANTENSFGGKSFCKFDTVTMVPISTKLVDLEIIDDAELNWLNQYNLTVRNNVMAFVESRFPEAISYLITETQPLVRI